MKEHIIKISCDKCGKQTEFVNGTAYPYAAGWDYLQSLTGKFAKKHTHKLHKDCDVVNVKDKHFCSQKCTITFIGNVLEEVYKTTVVDDTEEDQFGEQYEV